MRKTKIVCTIGPASEDRALIKKLIFAGMNVARLNFSHGTHDEHAARIDLIRACAEEAGLPVAIMLDTKGPEIRTGLLKDGFITLFKGDEFTFTSREIEGTIDKVSITYKNLPDDVDYGTKILLDDGLIELEVQNAQNGDVHCRVINGGVLKERKGVNVPRISLNIPNLTEKGIRDITFGIEKEVDFIAVSFVRKAQDVFDIRSVLDKYGSQISIISKIEKRRS
jgi:pyruvate kinase